MTIEEKAKRYDDLLVKLQEAKVDDNVCDERYCCVIDNIVPELKDSEDEKVKKEIKQFIRSRGMQLAQSKVESWIAWLEKQYEHSRFREVIQVGDHVTKNEDGVLVNLSQLKRVAKKDEKQGEQKPYGQREECVDCQFNYAGECKGFCAMKRGEQKPAEWSEEDDKRFLVVIAEFAKCAGKSVSKDEWMRCNDWLNSLRDRVVPQPKREWSEDDSVMIDNILGTYKTLEDMLDLTTSQDKDILESMNFERDWIKSLKYRIQPKQEWSEEDERNLNDAILFIETGTYSLDKDNLINWLKSLRPQNRCGWNDMSVKPIYPCDILYQQPNGNMFIYRYIEGGRANDAQTPTFCNLDENGKWIYLKDVKPQNTWKPSDEQMGAMGNAIKPYCKGYGWDETPLGTLYNDLKKL